MKGLTTAPLQRTFLSYNTIAGAYCGWLMSSSQFREEHDALWDALQKTLDANHLLKMPLGPFEALASGKMNDASSLVLEYQNLCSKWRLDRLPGPYLPVPAMPKRTVCPKQLSAGTVLYIPDIYAYRTAQQPAKPGTSADSSADDKHLQPWHEILSASNRNKGKQIERYRQLFVLAHVWTALQQRHSDALYRKRGDFTNELAKYLSMGASTLRGNLLVL